MIVLKTDQPLKELLFGEVLFLFEVEWKNSALSFLTRQTCPVLFPFDLFPEKAAETFTEKSENFFQLKIEKFF